MNGRIFDYWTSISDLATYFGVKYETAQSWVFRGYIPVKQDAKRLEKAQGAPNAPITAAAIAKLMVRWADERAAARKDAK